MSTYHTETQEGIAEIMTEAGCKACEGKSDEGWWECEGDVYCWTCALKLDRDPENTVTWIETAAQRETRLAWEAAGIGSN